MQTAQRTFKTQAVSNYSRSQIIHKTNFYDGRLTEKFIERSGKYFND